MSPAARHHRAGRLAGDEPGLWPLLVLGIAALAAAILLWMGRTPICTCGYVSFWHGEVNSSGNSQHLTDWYTPSHIVHGFLFYAATWLVLRRAGFWPRLALATLVEAAWEVVENTEAVIRHYRETTISLDYFGDSVINSVMDIAAMWVGFWLAARLPVWLSVVLVLAMELFVGWMIRDNLTLNVLMLLWPLESVKSWQSGGG
ncbi:DUF2585 domain-containing protein [Roseomonas sp. AR75]|uniref:DUF2585 domain-containing protein n=1 Tax=Roseomonas sp. AR75 TaxID=2562311 RepID=UPI001F0CF411|nr:DUF2585 domain-containing protein [Roseomonas sp. AR75]